MTITRRALGLSTAAAAAAALSACSFFDSDEEAPVEDASLVLLVDSLSQAETTALQDAVAAFTDKTGIAVAVQLATDLDQEITSALASGTPAELVDNEEVRAVYLGENFDY